MSSATGTGGDKRPRSFEAQFEEQQASPFPWKAVVKRAVVVAVAGVALYLVAPSVIAVLHSWPRLVTLTPIWLVVALMAEVGHFACTFSLQRIALRTKAWFPVVTAQLAGNAISLIVPGGAAPGAAVQFRMLAASGMDAADAVGGLTAFSLLGIAGLLALPVLVLPILLFGSPVSSGLYILAIIGAVAFVLFTGFSAVVAAANAPLEWLGRAIQAIRNRLFRRRPPMTGLPDRLLEQRDLIRSVLGRQWWQATLLSAGRLALDYLCLLGCVRAVGSHPRPSLVLLAYAVAGVIGLVPITPGGLGIVEASLSGLLVLVGLTAGEAVLATLAYRLASYWIPLMAGPVAYALFKRRYRDPGPPGMPSAAPSPL
ncbi:MAG: lysylphosphatidylglycerol synthase transmembrane domain-containing protein [Acidimicrobiales bacterium]|jgi:uncharacterized protein (TIRG00374 family)